MQSKLLRIVSQQNAGRFKKREVLIESVSSVWAARACLLGLLLMLLLMQHKLCSFQDLLACFEIALMLPAKSSCCLSLLALVKESTNVVAHPINRAISQCHLLSVKYIEYM